MDKPERLFKKGVKVIVLRGTGILLSYAFTLLITNYYGAKGFGQYSMFFAIVNILAIVALFGTDRAVIKLYNQRSYEAGAQYVIHSIWAVIASSLFFTVILYFSWDFLATIFFKNSPEILQVKPYAIILIGYSLFIFISEAIRAKSKMGIYGLFRFNLVFVFAVLFLLFLPRFDSQLIPIKSFSYSVLLTALLAIIMFFFEFRMDFNLERKIFKRIFRLSYPMLLASSMGLIVGWIDTFMLGYFINEEAVGIYNVAFKVAFISSILLTSINTVISPRIAKLTSDDKFQELRLLIRKISKVLALGATGIFLVTLFNMELILSFFGAEFTEGIQALSILLIGQFVSSYSGPVAIILQMSGYEKTFMYISIVAMTINVVMNLILIPEFGYLGAAIASAFTLAFNNLCCVYYVKKELGFYSFFIPFTKYA